MREPRPDWSPLGVNFKILDEHPYLFYISSHPPPPPGSPDCPRLAWDAERDCRFICRTDLLTKHYRALNRARIISVFTAADVACCLLWKYNM